MTVKTMSIAAVRAAAAFFEANPDKRTTLFLARDASGMDVSPRSDQATCWCALGRIVAELDEETYQSLRDREDEDGEYDVARKIVPDIDEVYSFNDPRRDPEQSIEVATFLRKLADDLEA